MTVRLDTTSRYETPEGIELEFVLAGPLVRGLAWAVDFGIRALCYLLLFFLLSLFDGVGMGLLLIGVFLIEWFYPVFFEMRSGMTPGKRVFALRVIQADGSPLTWTSSLLRNLLRAADFLPFLYAAGFLSMLVNAKFKRLGDLAADTLVVYHGRKEKTFQVPKYPARPFPWPLTLAEQHLILQFVRRSESLSPARRRELTDVLADFTGQDHSPEQVFLAHANWQTKGR